MLGESDALALIEGLENASRRTRPMIFAGLIAIIAGFAILSYYLYDQRREVEQRNAELTARLDALTATIEQAKQLAATPQASQGQVSEALGSAIDQAHSIGAAVAAAEKGEEAPAAAEGPARLPPTVRIFIQIASEEQRDQAAALARQMASRTIEDSKVEVPGIELVKGKGDDSLRCLTPRDCRHVERVTAWANRHLARRQLHATNLSTRYGKAKVKPGTYELWFAPGPIEAQKP
jgi:hypothetical protein